MAKSAMIIRGRSAMHPPDRHAPQIEGLRGQSNALPQRIEGIPLEKGWNHVLLKVGQLWGGWNGRFRFIATDPAYMRQLESVIMQ